MRSFSLPLPTLFAGFVAVLVGYASSAAIIWQAAAAAGATPGQIAGWMTALGLAMGISTLALSAWRKVPVLTAWSTPGAALLVSGLQGVTLAEAVGIFIFANALIVICGTTGLFARLMQIIPHSLAAAMLAGILLRFGLQAFAGLQDHLPLCGGMLAAWLLCKALWPRFAVVAALVIGALIAAASGDVASAAVPLAFVTPEWVAPQFTPALLLSVGLPFFPRGFPGSFSPQRVSVLPRLWRGMRRGPCSASHAAANQAGLRANRVAKRNLMRLPLTSVRCSSPTSSLYFSSSQPW